MSDAEFRAAAAEASAEFTRGEYNQLLLSLSIALEQLGGRIYLSDEMMAEHCETDLRFVSDSDDNGVWIWIEKCVDKEKEV